MDPKFPTHTQFFTEGLITDTNRMHQPKNSYRFALNAILESIDGDIQTLNNELGNTICASIPDGYEIIGNVVLDTNEVLLFLTDSTTSIIAIQTQGCKLIEYLKSTCLKFNTCYPVDSVFRLQKGCDRIIYFTDDLNPPMAINLDSLEDYVTDTVENDISLIKSEDKIAYANLNNAWDCDKLKMFPNLNVPVISLNRVNNTGGRIKVGAQQFAIRYLDRDLNPSNWFYVSPVVPIYDENLNTRYRAIDGGLSAVTGMSTSQDTALPLTTKSIILDITNLDASFPYYQMAVLESSEGIGEVTNVYIKPKVVITADTDIYTYTGVNTGTDIASTINEIVIPRLVIDRAAHIEQIDNRLLLANVASKAIDFSTFQKQASRIGSKYVVTSGGKEKINLNSPKSPNTYFDLQNYMRDEIYAFAVVWVFKNGTESPAFHIPGRPLNTNPINCSTLPSSGTGVTTTQVFNDCLYINVRVFDYQTTANSNQIYGQSAFTTRFKKDGIELVRYYTAPLLNEEGLYPIEVECGPPGTVYTEVTVASEGNVDQTGSFEGYFVGIAEVLSTYLAGGDPSIPQAITGWDSTIIPFGSSDDVQHYEEIPQGGITRWHAFNTAYKLNDTEGILAYYDTGVDNLYPNILDCSGNNIWGVDICGNELTGTPIRHHKFPAASLEPIQRQNNIYHLGIEFFNIVPPEAYKDLIEGYYIVRALRDENNKTILDKGYLDRSVYLSDEARDRAAIEVVTPLWLDAHITYLGLEPPDFYIDNDTDSVGGATSGGGNNSNDLIKDHKLATTLDRVYAFHSPRIYFNRDSLNATYVKVESQYSRLHTPYRKVFKNLDFLDRDTWDILSWQMHDEGSTPQYVNRRLNDSTYIDARPGYAQDAGAQAESTLEIIHPNGNMIKSARVINHLASNHVFLVSLSRSLDTTHWFYVSLKRQAIVYGNLDSLKYYRTHSGVLTDTFSRVYGGDTHISRLSLNIHTYDDDRAFFSGYTESEINVDLRHAGSELFEKYYNGPDLTVDNNAGIGDVLSNASGIAQYMNFTTRHKSDQDYIDKYGDNNKKNAYKWIYPDYWAYNLDYSKQTKENLYVPLDSNYDFCKKCINEFPYRIHFSQQSFQEEQTDNYKAFLANNYSDLMGDQGEITNLFIDRDRLFAHAKKVLWQIQTKPNEIMTSESTIFVGAGELLSIPPRKLVSTDYGYGGSVDKLGTKTNEFGTVFLDSNMGKIFLLDQGLKEISLSGERNWFENNLKPVLVTQYLNNTGLEYPCRRFTGKYGVGVLTMYDPRFRRSIVHKRDFSIIDESLFKGALTSTSILTSVLNDGDLVFNTTTSQFVVVDNTDKKRYNVIDISYTKYFENKSWTKSYAHQEGKWVSFHSYMPHFGYNDHETFYTFNRLYRKDSLNVTWKHNTGLYQSFYGHKHPFILELVANPDPTKSVRFRSFSYGHDTVTPNDTGNFRYVENVTFDTFYAYTDDEMTATCSIVPKTTAYQGLQSNTGISYARFVDDGIFINDNLRSISLKNGQSFFTNEWSNNAYRALYNVDGIGNGYIDRIPNELARDINISVYKRARLSNVWLGLRYTFNPAANIQLSMQQHDTQFIVQIR